MYTHATPQISSTVNTTSILIKIQNASNFLGVIVYKV